LKLSIEESEAQITTDPLPEVLADETQMVQVFQNLIANAIKFRKDTEKPRIHIAARQKDNQWHFSVQDNGIGIDPQFHDRIFVAFQRLHARRDKYPGTGIGLAVVKRIIERHGGQICVDSTLGKGSTFYFTLPVIQAKDEDERK
jgi:light-regulated signal transduction histidine kinase (bacteriophytochrome)